MTEQILTRIVDDLIQSHFKLPETSEAPRKRGTPRKVRCKETGEVFQNAVRASLAVGLNFRAVSKAIYQNCRCGGYYWEYI